MSLASGALSEAPMASDPEAAAASKGKTPKTRTLMAKADPKQAVEPR